MHNPSEAHKNAKLIGVAMSHLNSYIFPNILKCIDDVLTRLNSHILPGITYNRVENKRHFLQSCLEHSVEGIIIEASKIANENPNLDLYRELESRSIPCIFINGYYSGYDCNYCITDDIADALAESCLVEAGHRKDRRFF